MNNQHFSQDDLKRFETPMQKLMHLNLQALKRFSDFSADDLFNSKQPGSVWKKNLETFLKNSQTGLIYLQGVFSLMEEHLSTAAAQTAKTVEKSATAVKKSAKKPMKNASSVAKKLVSTVKNTPTQKKPALAAKTKAATKQSHTASTANKAVKTPVKSMNKTTKPAASRTVQMQASVKKPEVKNAASLHNPAHFKPATGSHGMKPNF